MPRALDDIAQVTIILPGGRIADCERRRGGGGFRPYAETDGRPEADRDRPDRKDRRHHRRWPTDGLRGRRVDLEL